MIIVLAFVDGLLGGEAAINPLPFEKHGTACHSEAKRRIY